MTLLHVFDLPFEGMAFYSSVDETLVLTRRKRDAGEHLDALAQSIGLEETHCIVVRGDGHGIEHGRTQRRRFVIIFRR